MQNNDPSSSCSFLTGLKLTEQTLYSTKRCMDLVVVAFSRSPISNLTSLKWLEVSKYAMCVCVCIGALIRDILSLREKKIFAMVWIIQTKIIENPIEQLSDKRLCLRKIKRQLAEYKLSKLSYFSYRFRILIRWVWKEHETCENFYQAALFVAQKLTVNIPRGKIDRARRT